LACSGLVGLVTIGASTVAAAAPRVLRPQTFTRAAAPAPSPVAAACTFPAHLALNGGTALAATQAALTIVEWGGTVNPQAVAAASSVYETMESSSTPYVSWWQFEYSIPPVTVGADIVIAPANFDPKVNVVLSDAQIQAELVRQMQLGVLQPGTSTLYLVHLPPTISVSDSGGSCVTGGFCAYHSSFTAGTQSMLYAVIPDFASTDCSTLCFEGASGSWQQSLQMAESHEVIEMLTDPDTRGWTDPAQPRTCGDEIGDICNGEPAQIDGQGGKVTVQKMWSNLAVACVTNAIPEIASISPATGPTSGGQPVTITGANFNASSGGTSFAFSLGNFATQVSCPSTTVCTALTPPFLETISLNYPVQVTAAANTFQSSSGGSQDTYTYQCPQRTCSAGACGTLPDGCGGTISCGVCPSGQVCFGQTCCTPLSPAQACGGKTCGTASDGCGGGVTCGGCCTVAQACGSKTCGTASDGCGRNLTCGFCPVGMTCNLGTCIRSCPQGQVFCDGHCTRPTNCQ
jgi:hypothetical protein